MINSLKIYARGECQDGTFFVFEVFFLNITLRTLDNKIFENYLKTLKYHSFFHSDFRTKCFGTYL